MQVGLILEISNENVAMALLPSDINPNRSSETALSGDVKWESDVML